jgi:hypothetical protein
MIFLRRDAVLKDLMRFLLLTPKNCHFFGVADLLMAT